MALSIRIILLLMVLPWRGMAAPSRLGLFESSYQKAKAGLARQQSRLKLAEQQLHQAERLFKQGFVSVEERENATGTVKLAELDLAIAQSKAKEAKISLQMARALARNAQRIPLCVRKRQKDEDTVSERLKRPPPPPFPAPDLDRSGTRVLIDESRETRDPEFVENPRKEANAEPPTSPFPPQTDEPPDLEIEPPQHPGEGVSGNPSIGGPGNLPIGVGTHPTAGGGQNGKPPSSPPPKGGPGTSRNTSQK